MKPDQISDRLIELNKENIYLLNSNEYKIGKKIINLIDCIKSHKILTLIKEYKNNKKISKYTSLDYVKNEFSINYNKFKELNKKVVIYTCITGKYDKLVEPIFYDENIKYVAFLDNCIDDEKNIWEIRKIPQYIKNLDNNVLINRYIKFKAHELFKEYDYSIYIDGNLKVIGDLRNFITMINNKTGLAFHRHSCRCCIYDEAEVLMLKGKGNSIKIFEEINEIKKNGFPEKFGLYEANVIVTNLKNNNAQKILDMWYEEFASSKCERDQIILPYIVWKLGFKFNDIGCLGHNVHKNPYIRKEKHLKEK